MKIRQVLIGGLVLCLTGFVLHMIHAERGLSQFLDNRRQQAVLETEARHLADENRRMAEEVELLRTDPEVLEHVLRDEKNLVRPDEVVYLFPQAETDGD